MITDVGDLRVYQQSLQSLRLVYRLASYIPPQNEKLSKQITSSAESVPALIAEGFAKRKSDKEFRRFLEMAMGSSDETITHSRVIDILSERFPRIPKELCSQVEKEYISISKQLNRLRSNWQNFPKPK